MYIVRKHDCRQNYDESAKSMEADMAIEMFERAPEHGMKYTKIVGDEDATTYAYTNIYSIYDVLLHVSHTLHIYLHIHTNTYEQLFTQNYGVHILIHIHIYASYMYIHTSYMYVHIYILTYTTIREALWHAYTHTHTHIHIHTHTHTRGHTYTYVRTNTYIYIYIQWHTHIYIHTYYPHMLINTHAHTYTYIYTP